MGVVAVILSILGAISGLFFIGLYTGAIFTAITRGNGSTPEAIGIILMTASLGAAVFKAFGG
jgi:hypothetical protein